MKNLITTAGITMLILFAQNLIAQSELFEETEIDLTELNDEQKDKYDKLKSNTKFKKVSRIKINNLKKLQKEGKIKFKIPNQQHKVTAYPTYVDAIDLETFEWVGELIDKNGLTVGSLTLLSESGALYGTMQAYEEEYILQDIGTSKKKERITLLIQHDAEILAHTGCNVSNTTREDEFVRSAITESRSNCNADIRVLVLYTTKAYNTGISPSYVASSGISNMNQALRNSDINSSQLTFTLAGVQRIYNVNETNRQDYVSDLTDSENNEYLRNQYRADLVITLTKGDYYRVEDNGSIFNIFGVAGLNDPITQQRKYGLVEIEQSNTNTFVHELGHLMGGRHENNSNSFSNRGYEVESNFPPDCGFYFKTIMHHISSGAIPHFSNPDTTYNQCPTGTNNHNVVARILQNRCTVYNFNTNNSDFQAYINGPSYIYNSSQYFTWSPQVTGCNGSVTNYTWAYSTNGYSWTNFSYSYSGSKMGSTFPYGYRNLFIRLTVNCSNGEVATRVKPITNYSFYNYFSTTESESTFRQSATSFIQDAVISISPNPVSNFALLKINMQKSGAINIKIISAFGQNLEEIDTKLVKGYNEIKLDMNKYENGLYLITTVLDNNIQSLPLIIQK